LGKTTSIITRGKEAHKLKVFEMQKRYQKKAYPAAPVMRAFLPASRPLGASASPAMSFADLSRDFEELKRS
jgi:hypothetical protein